MSHASAQASPAPPQPGSLITPRRVGYLLCATLSLLTLALDLAGAAHTIVFVVAALALMSLAWLIGLATESVGAALGPRIGGVISQTFANAPELIISYLALRAGLVEVVKASITGSIIGNLLLVLGASLFAGGLKNGIQRFSQRNAQLNATMLVIAVVGLFIPAAFSYSVGPSDTTDIRHLSDGVSVVLIVMYLLSLVFFLGNPAEGNGPVIEEEGAVWKLPLAVAVLLGAAVSIAVLSEILVSALEPTIEAWGISKLFAGLILIPIIGNLAENLVAVQLAVRNKMDFSLLISTGSSLQVAVFVAPILVLLSHLAGTPMNLVFTQLELVTVGLTVVLVSFIAIDGESNWFEGAELLAVYLIVALAFFFHP